MERRRHPDGSIASPRETALKEEENLGDEKLQDFSTNKLCKYLDYDHRMTLINIVAGGWCRYRLSDEDGLRKD